MEKDIDGYLEDPNALVNEVIAQQIPPMIEPREYLSVNGVFTLVVVPFVQGLFHGFGEGISRIYLRKLLY